MWIKTTVHQVMEGEPQLGTQEETELMEEDGEALGNLLQTLEDDQECPDTFIVIDDNTEEDIQLTTSDYITGEQIDMLNEMFMADNNWDIVQIEFMLDQLQLRK